MNAIGSPRSSRSTGFSLLEVVVAIGLFGTGIVTVIGVLGVLAKSVTANAEASCAARLGDALQIYLAEEVKRAASLAPARALMTESESSSGAVLFASRDGLNLGQAGEPIWAERASDQFFEIRLYPPSPGLRSNDALLCYVAEIRWPVARATDSGAAQQVLHLAGAVSR
jgi:type II secretory pathway component PulJ